MKKCSSLFFLIATILIFKSVLKCDKNERIMLSSRITSGADSPDGMLTLYNKREYIDVIVHLRGENISNEIYMRNKLNDAIKFKINYLNDKKRSVDLIFVPKDIRSHIGGEAVREDSDNVHKVNGHIVKINNSDIYMILDNAGSITIEGRLYMKDKTMFKTGVYRIDIFLKKDYLFINGELNKKWSGAIHQYQIKFKIIIPKSENEIVASKYLKSEDFAKNGNYKLAEKELKEILRKWPDKRQFYFHLGRIYQKKKQYVLCSKTLGKVRESDIYDYSQAISLNANCLIAAGKNQEAKNILKIYYKDEKEADNIFNRIIKNQEVKTKK